ncbi:MAG: hypothetical protein AAFU53_16385 [Cyanobacteria bacterium J06632_3]
MNNHLPGKKPESQKPGQLSKKALSRQELIAPSFSRHQQPSEQDRFHLLRQMDIDSVWGILNVCEVRELAPGEHLINVGAVNQ